MTTYYVDTAAADDTGAGTSEGTAWKTVTKVNATAFSAGDTIKFKCGDLWRERITPAASGSSGNVITYTSYGIGNKPRFYASDLLTGWTEHDTNIWEAAHTGAVAPIWFIAGDGTVTWGDPKASIVACVNEYDWFYDSNLVYVYAASDPDARYASIEAGYRNEGIIKNNKNYITIDGLEVAFSAQAGIQLSNIGYTDWTIQNCDIHHCGVINASAAHGIVSRDNNSVFQNNRIWHCGGHGIYAIAGGAGTTVSGIIIRDNEVWDCPHTGIDIMSYTSTARLTNVDIYRNIVYSTSAYPGATGVYMTGIQTSAESGGLLDDVKIYNNLVYNNYGVGILITQASDNVIVANNTVYDSNGSFVGIDIEPDTTNVTVKNNLVYNQDGINIAIKNSASITAADYNLSYHTTEESDLIYKVDATRYSISDFAAFKVATSFEAHGVWADPKIVSATDHRLNAGSPAQDAGVYITGIHDETGYTDLAGITSPIRANPSMGAYEYIRKIIRGRIMPGNGM